MPSKKSAANAAIGTAVRDLRKERGFSQEGFAVHADIDRSYYGAIERGEYNVTVDTLATIAAGLELPVSELFKRADL